MRVVVVIMCLLLAGCAQTNIPADDPIEIEDPDQIMQRPTSVATAINTTCQDAPLACQYDLLEPVVVAPAQPHTAEPSIVVTEHAIVITDVQEPYAVDPNLASTLLTSPNGTEWSPLPSPSDLQRKMPGLEGDIAIDDAGDLYFVDMYTADVSFSRWAWDDGWQWEHSTPLAGTVVTDDRPWLAAHGDGQVYLLVNNAEPTPTVDPEPGLARWWMFTSSDGGLTWSIPQGFHDALYCYPSAQPGGDRLVVACREPGLVTNLVSSATDDVVMYVSEDRGATFERHVVATHTITSGHMAVPSTVLADGRIVVAVMPDDDSGSIRVGQSLDGTEWTWSNASLPQTWDHVWLSASAERAVTTFYAKDGDWYVEGILWDLTGNETLHLRLDPQAAGPGDGPAPRDFFQNAMRSNGDIHVAYDRSNGNAGPSSAMWLQLKAEAPTAA